MPPATGVVYTINRQDNYDTGHALLQNRSSTIV